MFDTNFQNPKPNLGNLLNVNTTQKFALNSPRPHEGSFKAFHKFQ